MLVQSHAGYLGLGVGGQVIQLVGIVLQPRLHVFGHVILVKRALIGIAQNSGGAVVSTHDDVAVGLTYVKHIIVLGCLAWCQLTALCCQAHALWGCLLMFVQESQCLLHSLILTYIACP